MSTLSSPTGTLGWAHLALREAQGLILRVRSEQEHRATAIASPTRVAVASLFIALWRQIRCEAGKKRCIVLELNVQIRNSGYDTFSRKEVVMNSSGHSAMGIRTTNMINRLSTLARLLTLIFLLAGRANAQNEVTMSVTGPGGSAHSVAQYASGTIKVEFESRVFDVFGRPVGETNTDSSKLSDLDLDNVDFGMDSTRYNRFYAGLNCKADRGDCVSEQITSSESTSSGNSLINQIVIWCDSQNECQQFINTLRQAEAPRSRPVVTNPMPQSVQTPPVQTRPAAPAPAQPQAAVQASAPATSPAAVSALRDLISMISWLNGAQGVDKSTLDKLLKQIEAGRQPMPPPPAKPVYAAFAQAGGFDANGAWGGATASDLNTAIASAN
jgi:hypothetical protein